MAINAVLDARNGLYFFENDVYYKSDKSADAVVDGYPRLIRGNWKGVWPGGIDGAVENLGHYYFFRGSEYIRYNIDDDKALADYPRPIESRWPGVWTDGVDAVLDLGGEQGDFVFFKGDLCLAFNCWHKCVLGYPRPIASRFEGVWKEGIDCAFRWQRSTMFFKGDQYIRYSGVHDRADDGYPRPIADNWKGLGGRRPAVPDEWIAEVLAVSEAAQILRVGEADVTALLESGQLKGKKIGGDWRISRAAVDTYLKS